SGQHGGEVPMDCALIDELPAASESSPEHQYAEQQLELRLQRALQRLSGEQRALVLLSRVRELGTEELAQLFDCSAAAVKVRLHRSLALLRQYFAAEDESQPNSPQREKHYEL